MSDLRPKGTPIVLGGKTYGMLFTLNAIDEIQDRFDISISQITELMNDERKVFKVLKAITAILINEHIDDSEAGEAHVDEKFIGRKITPANIGELQAAILKAFGEGMPLPEDVDPNAKSE